MNGNFTISKHNDNDTYKILLKIPWTDFVSKARLLVRVGEQSKKLVEDVKNHKMKCMVGSCWQSKGKFKGS